MRCPACAADNLPTAKFCGVCGTRLAAGPPTVPPEPGSTPSARTSVMASSVAPPLSPAPLAGATNPGSQASSLALPEAPGPRVARLVVVLALDAALVAAGAVLATRERAAAPVAVATVEPVTGADGGVDDGRAPEPGPAPREPGPPRVVPGPGPQPVIVPPLATDAGVSAVDGRATDAGRAVGVDATPVVVPPRLVDAAPPPPPPPAIDAALPPPPPPPPPIDAAPPPPPPPIDAAVEAPPVDAAPPDVDAPEAAVSADEIVREANRLAVASVGRLDRCYQSATKVLPADQPLRGRVDIGLAVLPTGAVDSVIVLQNTTGSDQLGQCVHGVVASWRFSAHDAGEPVHVSRVFSF